MASRARHRRRRRSTLPVPALAGSAAVAVAVAGSLTASASGSSGRAGDVLVLDAPSRPAVSTGSVDPFSALSEATDTLGVVTQEASTSAHQAIREDEIEVERRAAEERAAREAEERERLARMFVAPVSSYTISSPFGGYRGHGGLDLAGPYGQPVRAVHSGTVVSAGWDGSYGYKVEVRHADGTETWYAHLSSISVGLGPVSTGTVLGALGSTGRSTGPHLHLEVRTPGDVRINPYPWLAERGVSL